MKARESPNEESERAKKRKGNSKAETNTAPYARTGTRKKTKKKDTFGQKRNASNSEIDSDAITRSRVTNFFRKGENADNEQRKNML